MHTCDARTRSGQPCKLPPVTGAQRCRMHGGTNPGRPIETGRYSVTHRASLAAKHQRFLEDPRPHDLTDELALMRALLQDYLDRYVDGVSLPALEIERFFGMLETVSRLVERISRIFNETALTQAEVRLLEVGVVDIITRYVNDPVQRLALADDLAQAFGAGRRDTQQAYPAVTAAGE
jgi:hypothetical protein